MLTGGGIAAATPRGAVWCSSTVGEQVAVVFAVYEKLAQSELFEPVIQVTEAAMSQAPRLVIFVDGERFEGYETEFREKWTRWFLKNRARLDGMHFLVRSAIVKMGLNLIGLAVSGLVKPYSDRAQFERMLGPHLDAYRRLRREADAGPRVRSA